MGTVLRNLFKKNNIAFWHITDVSVCRQNNIVPPYKINLTYRTEPFETTKYIITSTIRYIPYKTTERDIKKLELPYTSTDNFVSDVKFLMNWGVKIDIDPAVMKEIESQSYLHGVRLVC